MPNLKDIKVSIANRILGIVYDSKYKDWTFTIPELEKIFDSEFSSKQISNMLNHLKQTKRIYHFHYPAGKVCSFWGTKANIEKLKRRPDETKFICK